MILPSEKTPLDFSAQVMVIRSYVLANLTPPIVKGPQSLGQTVRDGDLNTSAGTMRVSLYLAPGEQYAGYLVILGSGNQWYADVDIDEAGKFADRSEFARELAAKALK